MLSPDYREKVMQWRSERDASLRQENGWLALAGLFWLHEGENRLGSEPGSDILLPPRAPRDLGSIHFDGKQATLRLNAGLPVQVNDTDVRGETLLRTDLDDSPSYISLDGIRLVIIERPSGFGVRMWDNLRPELRISPPREWYPIDEALRLPARYERYAVPRKVLIPDVFGHMNEEDMQGQVTFELAGRLHTLDVFEGDDHRLEIHFQDTTNGRETYPSGRYYYTEEPVSSGKVILDFNFAYNPPCAFTPYATCSFAPAANRLNIPIAAGERYPLHPH